MKIYEKCVCGHLTARHTFFEDHDECSECDSEKPCIQYRPAEDSLVCTADEQQCDAECQARPDRKCATVEDVKCNNCGTGVKIAAMAVVIARERIAQLERERDEAQNDRQREHDLRVTAFGSLEGAMDRIRELEYSLAEALALLQRVSAPLDPPKEE